MIIYYATVKIQPACYNSEMLQNLTPYRRLALICSFAVLVGFALFFIGVWRNQSGDYWYLGYNLLLGVIPLAAALWLQHLLKSYSWRHALPVIATLLWLLFLPNSFYIVTDFIHLPETQRVDIVQDVVMIMQFSVLGLIFGFMSLYMVQHEFAKRVGRKWAMLIALIVLFLCSFAIYIGRDLRWNSWDVIANPITMSSNILGQFDNPLLYSITLSFFAFLVSIYAVVSYTNNNSKY